MWQRQHVQLTAVGMKGLMTRHRQSKSDGMQVLSRERAIIYNFC